MPSFSPRGVNMTFPLLLNDSIIIDLLLHRDIAREIKEQSSRLEWRGDIVLNLMTWADVFGFTFVRDSWVHIFILSVQLFSVSRDSASETSFGYCSVEITWLCFISLCVVKIRGLLVIRNSRPDLYYKVLQVFALLFKTKIYLNQGTHGGAWPFLLVGGVICLVNSDNEQDSGLLNK